MIRSILLPGSGILILKAAKQWGFVNSDSFYQFTLLLQYAIPPAVNIGTMMLTAFAAFLYIESKGP